ncbi:unnamed protein product [Notodromas monacha]|uniref:Uncharacterized protein n=1 Tax=Notodromas monacha TaxID=399045 RepID=A0A7R9BUB6_9CRUS|nr:unnamed protein product [Notodromas monacha]CAG0921891.1 unnamed protein product [Notodromas monacha]
MDQDFGIQVSPSYLKSQAFHFEAPLSTLRQNKRLKLRLLLNHNKLLSCQTCRYVGWKSEQRKFFEENELLDAELDETEGKFSISEGSILRGPAFPVQVQVPSGNVTPLLQKCLFRTVDRLQSEVVDNSKLRRDLSEAQEETKKLNETLEDITNNHRSAVDAMLGSFVLILNEKKAGLQNYASIPMQTATSSTQKSRTFSDDEEDEIVARIDPSQFADEDDEEDEPVRKIAAIDHPKGLQENFELDDDDIETVPANSVNDLI